MFRLAGKSSVNSFRCHVKTGVRQFSQSSGSQKPPPSGRAANKGPSFPKFIPSKKDELEGTTQTAKPTTTKKFRELSIDDRRADLNLPKISHNIERKTQTGSLPFACVKDTQCSYPMVLEEASVVAGASGMLKLIGNRISVHHIGINRCAIRASIPLSSLTKGEVNGYDMAQGIIDIYRFSNRTPMRAITNNKGILNATYPFLKALYPSQAIRGSMKLLDNATYSGVSFSSHKHQYGPLIHWSIADDKLIAMFEFSLNSFDNMIDSNSFVDEAKHVFGLEKTKDHQNIMYALGVLAIAQNLAALRSIWFKGNRAHHMDHHHAATQDIPVNQLSRFDRLVECCIGEFEEPLNHCKIGNKHVAFMGDLAIADTVLELMSNAMFDIQLKPPQITAQVVYRKIKEDGNPVENFLKLLNESDHQNKTYREIMDLDNQLKDPTLTRLSNRLNGDIRVVGLGKAYQIGTNVICQNTVINVGETQGANRANAYAETSREVANKNKEITGWEAKGGILSNWHTDRGPTFEIRIPKEVFNKLNININKLIELSKQSQNDPTIAEEINIAALEGMIATDTATGQDTRGNIAAFDFASRETPLYGHGLVTESRYNYKTTTVNPFLLFKDDGKNILLQSGFPMASARTAVGRTVNNLDCAKDAREIMGIPIEGDTTGKVNQLDERACRLAVVSALNWYITEVVKKS
jgi:hydroxymethylglutaryl-CoA reductase